MAARARLLRPALAAAVALALIQMARIAALSDVGTPVAAMSLGPVGVQPDCRSRDDCASPLKGGLRITFTGWACTSGFVARDPAESRWYLVTAGHCLADSGLFARWSHGGDAVGRAAYHAFRQASSADAGAIEISAADASDQVFGATQRELLTLRGWVPNASQTVGSEVCRSGGTTGWTCGSITDVDDDVEIRGHTIRHTWWTDFPSAKGDSGAPIVDAHGRILGIVIATTPTQSLYSTVEGIAAEIDLQPYLTGGGP